MIPTIAETVPSIDFSKLDWSNPATYVAFVGTLVIVSRLIVNLTPTPKDNKVWAAVVDVLKKLGLYIPLFVLCGFLVGCAGNGFALSASYTDPETGIEVSAQTTK